MIRIRFDGPPGPIAPRFIEAEDGQGRSVRVGHWEKDPESTDWFLVLSERFHPLESKGPDMLATGRIQGVRYTEGQCFIVVGSLDAQAPQFGEIVTLHRIGRSLEQEARMQQENADL